MKELYVKINLYEMKYRLINDKSCDCIQKQFSIVTKKKNKKIRNREKNKNELEQMVSHTIPHNEV